MKKAIFTAFITILAFISSSALFADFFSVPEPEISVQHRIYAVSDSKNLIEIKVTYTFPEGYYQSYTPDFFRAQVNKPIDASAFAIEYPDRAEDRAEDRVEDKDSTINYYDSAVLKLVSDAAFLTEDNNYIEVEAFFQLCDEEGICYFPGSKTVSFYADLPEITAESFTRAFGTAFFEILKYALFALAGGLLLNIMPCVFPLLTIKALTLVKQGNDDKRKIFLSSAVYSLGIISSLIILALVVIALKSAGSFAGWGFQMQSRWFVISMITVIYVFALSMFDVFVITLPGGQTAGKASMVKGYGGHFLTGVFAVIVAAPCTAPFLGSALAFALFQNSALVILIFIFIGIGFSLPYLLLGLFPGLIKKIPKPGAWSVLFREILGFILAATALYFFSAWAKGAGTGEAVKLMVFLFTVTFAAWLYGKTAYPGAGAGKTVLAIALAFLITAGAAVILLGGESSIEKRDGSLPGSFPGSTIESRDSIYPENTKSFTLKRLESLLNERVPVFVNIYTDWCTTCKINDRVVFNSPEIRDFFSEMGIITLKGDFTYGDSDIAEWMMINRKAGVPVYAYYYPDASGKKPLFLPEILQRDSLMQKLREFSQ